jgi:small subunit ribosomal protein S9
LADTNYYATGRRKEATARVWLKEGNGEIVINGKKLEDYFAREDNQMVVQQPFGVIKTANRFDINATVRGGGITGQAGALRHGIARALLEFDISLKPLLRQAGFLTRDPRMKERKKYGRKGARRRFQFTKR